MSLLNFPNELLIQIAENLDRPSLFYLLLSNRRLSILLAPVFLTSTLASTRGTATALFLSAALHYTTSVTTLLFRGADITVSTALPHTPHIPSTLLYHRHPREFNSAISLPSILSAAPNIIVQDRRYGKTPLHFAAEKGKINLVRTLISLGHNVNIKDHDEDTALLCALKNNHDDIARILIDSGANIHAHARRGHTTFHLTAAWGHISIVALMLSKGANIESRDRDGHTVLHDAAQNGKEDMVKLLLEKGANINAQVIDAHMPPIEGTWGSAALRQYDFFREPRGDTPLHLAAKRQNIAMVRLLLEKGADTTMPGRDGNLASVIACERGQTDMEELLETYHVNSADRSTGETALHRAALHNDVEMAKKLLSKGAKINARKKTAETPLHIAVERDAEGVAQVLLDRKGIDVDAQCIFGETALFRAVVFGNQRMVQLLLDRGADPGIPDKKGRLAVEKAKDLKYRGMVKLLERMGLGVEVSA